MNQPSHDVLAILGQGGDVSEQPLEDVDIVDDELVKEIGALVMGDASAAKIAKALDAPASRISATLRRERRKIALLMFGSVVRNMGSLAGEYYHILDLVTQEVKRRVEDPSTLHDMDIKHLIKLAQLAMNHVQPLHDSLVLDPPDEKTGASMSVAINNAPTMNEASIAQMISAIHGTGQAADAELRTRSIPHHGKPPSKDDPIDIECRVMDDSCDGTPPRCDCEPAGEPDTLPPRESGHEDHDQTQNSAPRRSRLRKAPSSKRRTGGGPTGSRGRSTK